MNVKMRERSWRRTSEDADASEAEARLDEFLCLESSSSVFVAMLRAEFIVKTKVDEF